MLWGMLTDVLAALCAAHRVRRLEGYGDLRVLRALPFPALDLGRIKVRREVLVQHLAFRHGGGSPLGQREREERVRMKWLVRLEVVFKLSIYLPHLVTKIHSGWQICSRPSIIMIGMKSALSVVPFREMFAAFPALNSRFRCERAMHCSD